MNITLRKIFISLAGLMLAVANCNAADLLSYAPVKTYKSSWSGFYGGVAASIYDLSATAYDSSDKANIFLYEKASVKPSFFVGYNFALGNNFLSSLEANLNYLGDKFTRSDSKSFFSSKENYVADVDVRLAYDMGRFLPYATAGMSFLNRVAVDSIKEVSIDDFKAKNSCGVNLGFGCDYLYNNKMFLRAAYSLQHFSEPAVYDALSARSYVSDKDSSININSFRLGLGYKF